MAKNKNEKKAKKDNGLPMGFSMALAQNTKAMDMFAAMPKTMQENYITKAKSVNSKQEMSQIVQSITENQMF